MMGSFNLDKTYHFLLIALAFLLPLTVFGGNLVIVMICILWLISGDYKSKINQIIDNKLMLASILFFCIHIVGLIWTEDLSWGIHIVHKMWYFCGLLPILYTLMRKEYIDKCVSAFLIAISITEIFSYLIWFELIEPFKNATIENPTPFMSHISYNPILAFAIYLVLHEVFFNKKLTNIVFSFYSFFAISMTINMFITGGRAGQVSFFVMIAILTIQVLDKQRFKSMLAIFILIPGIFFTAYQTSGLFNKRVNMAISEILNYSDTHESDFSSVSVRVTYTLNSWEVIKQNPIIGVGTGDFPSAYKAINLINTPLGPNTTNPHNMYTLVLMQLGLIGLLSMLSIFYYQMRLSFNSTNKFIRDVGIMLPLMFLVIMFSDSYLLGHYTSLLYVFFSSFLYKDFEKS
jgi:O-antigen ligase